jgi:hypothetical protein
MPTPEPVVRNLVVCESVRFDPRQPRRITLEELLSAIRPVGRPPYPLLYREFSVFVQLTECRGPGAGRVDIVDANSDTVIFRNPARFEQ